MSESVASLQAAWQPNLTWITDDLAVGGRFPGERSEDLARDLGIGAVVDLRSEDRDDEILLAAHGILFLHLPTDDHGALSPTMLAEGLAFGRAAAQASQKLLIHCEHGIGRSATLALCVMVERGATPLDALAQAKDHRALISPSPAQYHCWVDWLSTYREAAGLTWEIPSFDRFAAIAYRHLRQG